MIEYSPVKSFNPMKRLKLKLSVEERERFIALKEASQIVITDINGVEYRLLPIDYVVEGIRKPDDTK